ncbi:MULTISPECIES: TetR/AcrR family transcriptional regulator [Tenacibaculum]|uniref:TetR/AcrR family transcriptional regulator n=1 Tax=Tenacibaculum TaxID=104267 RepID=UPI001F0AA635|nr:MULTISPECIES: TetR/AcrR family transcriptional regulator [Tenacibaculum]MCH3881637.1 TetR/AcrR family transcriptional regulator [Tenacibaculum aquimarinum]MCH3883468.1 TetR/AcrR family transcriptional regulator [Tenacibaculum aquimarinum]MDO6598778.1 TetR/AcrR family transcriptional regulator [Tenacibaculum sp. 1_MG-2023]
MKDKLLHTATEMFLNLGFKSVTMDDIAKEIGVSKKTIYSHFKNKTELVDEVTSTMFCQICDGIDIINEQKKNPIIELFEVKHFIMNFLKDEKSSPQYQLQKYYPKIFASLKLKQFEFMQGCIKENLVRGVAQDLYRKNLDNDFIARIYFNGMIAIKDIDLFPLKQFSMNQLMNYYLEYHLRGICTEKGIQILENQLKE